ncbi:trypsin-like peptidase domain-containing protein [Lentilactobacillus otakiensis]|uniref:Peptidase S1 and S6 chymotrypsin/Hap n=1 Tax=Lentilactobacillus otakiensis DSM 19908 = JCM 15040 TaxID=1423780 RepID=S4NSQ8_9LACO|nr:trypsin-like peptidase domain-containing protein [Lentilactobacillus otakiensis]KRL11986.1 peptidase S1 and S6 chymotrypsin Hap [Lentilactobacillus otakiensis DSM 19908 = JCM 15040]MBZ3777475.1 trypsin-like peptidase domain-containing protein [Lentilactobacillus otakiensis]MDV3517661.1 trypsin-like peptidase domain-containing protein [Lentilactobacillus otakiensis]GAD17018.1 peptidase S1 and S6 chymotrypsin/Hap [Lentilactobacillus otakiensis DSM 19908 = JCM 15040]
MAQNNGFGKFIATAVIAGALGGGITYGGVSYFNNNNNGTGTELVSGTNKNGNTKVSNVKVNLNTQAEKAFNATKSTVVSVINLQKQSSNDDTLSGILGQIQGGSSSSKKSSGELEASSEGSGVIYKKSGNTAYIVTNNHVVAGANALEIILSDGSKVSASVVGKDAVSDLAVIKIKSDKVTKVATFGDSDNIKVAEPVLAIGSPLGSQYATSVTQGIISAKKREVPQTSESGAQIGNATVIQTDAAINPGNSGGPLINFAGQVVGINSMKLASDQQGTSVEGMGFAIPSNEVVMIINQLIKNGQVIRPALGIGYTDLSNISEQQQRSILKLPKSVTQGAVVLNVNSNSPAKRAGLAKYDVITELDGTKITQQSQLRDILYKHKIGDKISVTYYHKGDKKTGSITLNEKATSKVLSEATK